MGMPVDELTRWLHDLHDEDEHTRSAAALSLGKLGDARAVDALIALLCEDESLNVQEDATWSLVRLGGASVAPLIERLSDARAAVRHNAAHALGKLGDARAIGALIARLGDEDAQVRLKAAYALGQMRAQAAVPGLLDCLADAERTVHDTALEALERIGAAALPALLEGLKHNTAPVREGCAQALGSLGLAQAVPGLQAALPDPDDDVRLALVQALGDIGGPQAVAALETLRDDADPRVRALARALLRA